MQFEPFRLLRTPIATTMLVCMIAAVLPCIAAEPRWKPERSIEIIAPASPGAGLDTFSRLISRLLTEHKLIELPITVVNKPGGGVALGATYLNQHAGNGHFLMLANPPLLTNHIMGRSALGHADITPIALLTNEATMFAVQADSALKTAKDLVERFKTDPGTVRVGISTSAGNHNHIAVAQLVKAAGANPKSIRAVIFGGSGEAMTAMLGGHIDLINTSPSALSPHYQAGRVKILAVTAERRLGGQYADIATCKEIGMNVVTSGWRMLVGPRGMNEEQARYWDGVFARLVQLADWKKYLEQTQVENAYLTARDSSKLLESEHAKFKSLLGDLGLVQP